MANNVLTDFRGKYVALGRSCAFRREAYVASDVVVVTGHARAERAKDITTNLAVFSAGTFAQFRAQAQAAGNFWDGDLQPAKQLLAGLSNGDLSRFIGTGKWKTLFTDETSSVLAAAPADAHDDRIGVQFTGTVPCIVDDSPDFMHGDWTVISKSGEGKYTVGALIEGNRVETVVSKTVLDKALELARRGGGEPQAPRRDDPVGVTFVADDYPLALKVIKVHLQHGSPGYVHPALASMPDDKFSCQLAMDVGKAAGWLPPPGVTFVTTTPESVWRRHAQSAIAHFETLLEMDAHDMRVNLRPLRQWNQADTRDKLLAMVTRVQRDLAPPVDGGAGVGVQGAPRRVTFAPGAQLDAGRQRVLDARGPANAPRYEALRQLAASDDDWDTFKRDALVFVVKDPDERRVTLSHERTCAGAIEGWLRKMGAGADSQLIASQPAGQSAGDLLQLCRDIQAQQQPDSAGGTDVLGRLQGQRPSSVFVMRTDTGSDTLSEVERRERSAVQADCMELERDTHAMQRLNQMASLADVGTEAARDSLVEAMGSANGALLRLLQSSTDASSVSMEADPTTVQSLSKVRGVLDASLETAVFGQQATRASDRVIRALRMIRTFKLGKCKLLHLIDRDDSSTVEDPLSGFLKLDAGDRGAQLSLCLQRMQAAWVFAVPSSSGQILQFITALQKQLLDCNAAGCEWKELSTFYAKVMRRADQQASGFAGRSTGKQEPPDPKWAKDPVYEWVAELMGAKVCATMLGKAMGIMHTAQTGRQRNAVIDLVDDDSPPRKKRLRKKKSPGQQQQQQQQQQQPQRPQKQKKKKAPADPADTDDDEPPAQRQKKETFLEMKARVTAELLGEKGEKDGRPPCFFFHKGANGCRYSAGDCKTGWHS